MSARFLWKEVVKPTKEEEEQKKWNEWIKNLRDKLVPTAVDWDKSQEIRVFSVQWKEERELEYEKIEHKIPLKLYFSQSCIVPTSTSRHASAAMRSSIKSTALDRSKTLPSFTPAALSAKHAAPSWHSRAISTIRTRKTIRRFTAVHTYRRAVQATSTRTRSAFDRRWTCRKAQIS